MSPLKTIEAPLVLNALRLLESVVGTKLVFNDIDVIEAFDDVTYKGSDGEEVVVFG
jgi:hypothetical protein